MDLSNQAAEYLTPFKIGPLLPLLLNCLGFQKNAPTTTVTFKDEYDYIVVGAGSAGAVVASRLSEISCVSVLLLEAGKSPPIINDVPVASRNFWFSDLDWQYKTVPQKHTGSKLINKQVIWPSGKGLGGSSLINGMTYARGNKVNYDDWARQGAKGWSYADVFPYFQKLEDNKDNEYLNDGYHASGGPVTVEKPRYEAEIKEPLIEAAKSFGYTVVDPSGESQIGIYDLQATQRNGQRCSTAKAYLVPADNRTNLDIVTRAFVRKVVIEDQQAVGVEFDHMGTTHTVRAKREVILSAGTINSAQLLMLSGIGPKKHLEDMEITVVADLPVGDNLQDHPAYPVPFQIDASIPSIDQKVLNASNILKYVLKKEGVYTSTEGVSLIAYLNGNQSSDDDVPDFQISFVETPSKIAKKQYGLTPEAYKETYEPYENSTMYICMAQNLHPKSRGTVRLQSSNPHDPPLIDPNYFDEPSDIQDVVEAMKMCTNIATSEPMTKKVGSKIMDNSVLDCSNASSLGDFYECSARSIILTTNHPVGTAKMGDPKDPTTVVDPQLRVKNVKGLRVVDASIMPTLPYGSTNIPAIMVGEKGSDIIKKTIDCGTTQIPTSTPSTESTTSTTSSPDNTNEGGFFRWVYDWFIFLIISPFYIVRSIAYWTVNLVTSMFYTPSITVGNNGSDIITTPNDTQIPSTSQNNSTSVNYENQGGYLRWVYDWFIYLILSPFYIANGTWNLVTSPFYTPSVTVGDVGTDIIKTPNVTKIPLITVDSISTNLPRVI